jgi:hypothetical protein
LGTVALNYLYLKEIHPWSQFIKLVKNKLRHALNFLYLLLAKKFGKSTPG